MASITDELRAWSKEHLSRSSILAIADRIDAEHEAKVSYWQGASYKDGYIEGFAGADDWLGQHEDAMAEHGWVKLPVDADGVPIRVWDVLDPPADCDDYVPLQVVRLTYDGYEDEWYFDGQAGGFTGMVGKCMDVAGWTHHRVPTVEDVLREFAHVGIRIGSKDGIKAGEFDFLPDEDAIAEYAKKLQLREGE